MGRSKGDSVIWGSSGHARVLSEILSSQEHRIVALFDNNESASSVIENVPLFVGYIGFQEWLSLHQAQEDIRMISGLVAIGGSNGRDRLSIQEFMKSSGLQIPVIQHPRACISTTSLIDEGSQMLAGSVISVMSTVGKACIINTNASVDHECIIGNGVHIAPGATLCGCVTVEDFSMIGAGAVVLPRLKIGADSIVGAGSVVTKDVPPSVVVTGNPARIVRKIFSQKTSCRTPSTY